MQFTDADLYAELALATPEVLDEAQFGVIGFDAARMVTRYNAFESRNAGLSAPRVVGKHLFHDVAPCMNNYLVAQRFDDEPALDATLDYVLTLRMRPTKVRLRLLQQPGAAISYVLVERT